MCDQYYIRFDLFNEMREEGLTGQEMLDKFAEVYYEFVSSNLMCHWMF